MAWLAYAGSKSVQWKGAMSQVSRMILVYVPALGFTPQAGGKRRLPLWIQHDLRLVFQPPSFRRHVLGH
eukprot:90071-Pyramimonas_sp.AAC.1